MESDFKLRVGKDNQKETGKGDLLLQTLRILEAQLDSYVHRQLSLARMLHCGEWWLPKESRKHGRGYAACAEGV